MRISRPYVGIFLILFFIGESVGQRLRKSTSESRKLVLASAEGALSHQYILRFKDDVTIDDIEQRANELAALMGASVLRIYQSVFKGFAFSLQDINTDIATLVANEEDVEVVEQVTSTVIFHDAHAHFNY